MSGTLQTVHVRVNDTATGKPTPVRIRIAGPDGTYYPPLGRLAEFATDLGVDVGGNVLLDRKQYAYIDGTCEVRLPAQVPLNVEIKKGPEYCPVATTLTLAAGKLALRLEIERWIDLRAERWYSGDTRCHFLSPHAALLEAAAEDVAVVNLLAWEFLAWGNGGRQHRCIPNILDFSGQRPALEMPGHMVVVNTLNLHESLGRLLLLNCHRIVYPLAVGGPDGFDTWMLADWCDQCHRKGGLVIGDDFFGHFPGYPHGELLADLILGKVDALQIDEFENPSADTEFQQDSSLKEWYELQDCGFRLPLVANSDKDSNLTTLGSARTYARLGPGQEFTYKNWIEAVRAGRTFVTTAPLLLLSVNGHDPGAALTLPTAVPTVHVRADARSLAPFHHLQVLLNNRIIATAEPTGSVPTALIETDVPVSSGGWLLARCWGPYDDAQQQWVAAITSPVYLQVEGHAPKADRALLDKFAGYLDEMLEWVNNKGRYENDQQRQRAAAVFESAKEVLKARS